MSANHIDQSLILKWGSFCLLLLGLINLFQGIVSLSFEWSTLVEIQKSSVGILGANLILQTLFALVIFLSWVKLRNKRAFYYNSFDFLKLRFIVYSVFSVFLYSSFLVMLLSLDICQLQKKWTVLCLTPLSISAVLMFPALKPDLYLKLKNNVWFRRFDVAMANLVIIVFGMEISLELMSRFVPSPLFYNASSASASVSAFKMPPNSQYFDFHCNSQGYYDHEFFPEGENDFVVAVIGDSFCFGKVPYDYNFITIAESYLRDCFSKHFERVAIHNFGVQRAGLMEYSYILETEMLPTDPSVLVLCLYVGNDISNFLRNHSNRYCFQQWWILKAPRALGVLKQYRKKGQPLEKQITKGEIPAYIFDSSLEVPYMDYRSFMEMEDRRIELCNPNNAMVQERYKSFFHSLNYFKDRFSKDLIIAVIPDELQVDDELYDKLLANKSNSSEYIRDYPQRLLTEYCKTNNIPLIDFLPPLKKTEPDKLKYLLQDMHWNVLANQISGKVLGKYLCDYNKESQ